MLKQMAHILTNALQNSRMKFGSDHLVDAANQEM
jgi:hypothetical protein